MKLSQKLLLTEENAAQLVTGKRVFIRVDFNVPIDSKGQITSDLRLLEALPTIQLVLKNNPKCIFLASHLGRPDGLVKDELSLKPVAIALARLLGKEVKFASDCIGPKVYEVSSIAPEGSVILLENLRFHVEEEGKGKNSNGEAVKASKDQIDSFRKELQSLADIYINDAFGTAHRAHSSMVGFDSFEKRVGGLLIAKEIRNFSVVLENPQKPVLTILGGAKVCDKIKLIDNLLDKTDKMIIGGGMAFTFLKVLQDMKIGKSLFDESSVAEIPKIMEKAKAKNVEIILPCDFITAPAFDSTDVKYADGNIEDDQMGLDIGEKSITKFKEAIMSATTILWNGPPGVFEKTQFEKGSLGVLDAVCSSNAKVKIAGGGDTTSLVLKQNKKDSFTLVSTGGGASLELLEGKELPGIAALSDN